MYSRVMFNFNLSYSVTFPVNKNRDVTMKLSIHIYIFYNIVIVCFAPAVEVVNFDPGYESS